MKRARAEAPRTGVYVISAWNVRGTGRTGCNRAQGSFFADENTFSTGTLFTKVTVYTVVPVLGRTLEKGDYQTDFIPVFTEGFPKVLQFVFAILYEALSIGRVTFELIDT